MTSPPLCFANLVVNETSSINSVTVPPTRQGPCSDSARRGPTPEAISKTSWLWSAGASEKKVKLLGGPWQALAAVSEHDCGADEILWILAFPVGVRKRPAEAGFANPDSLSRISSRTAESDSPINFFPLHWRGSLPRGSSARRPMPHTGSRGLVSANRLLPVLKKVMFHGGVLREFGAVTR